MRKLCGNHILAFSTPLMKYDIMRCPHFRCGSKLARKQTHKAAPKQLLMPIGWMKPRAPKRCKCQQIAMRNMTAISKKKLALEDDSNTSFDAPSGQKNNKNN